MDDPASKRGEGGGPEHARKHPLLSLLVYGCFVVAFSLIASLFFSFLFGPLVPFLVGSFSATQGPVSVPAQCRVVSSSVDLRSSRVCELALSNYKAKHVLQPSGKSKVRCQDDYYWASIFKVEYKDFFSGRTLRGVAESPKEALPLYCRPNFSSAWLTKSKFKVNETYQCRYSLGTLKADIYPDHLFKCQAEDPSVVEMIRRFSILFLNSINSFSWDKVRGWYHLLAAVMGIFGGILSSICVFTLVKLFQLTSVALSKKWEPAMRHIMMLATQFQRACLLIAYISAVGWVALQYCQFVGLKQIFVNSDSRTAITR
uniref:Baculoviral IAP repeat-containing protein 1a n=1 Tax=Anthurium amnicola TaxID=1678845 RepID=A0A1D1YG95_9ARAE